MTQTSLISECNVIWFKNINSIGGVESVIYNVVSKYPYDILIWYETADSEQLYRLSQKCRLLKFNPNQHLKCERLFINYGYEVIKGHYECDDVNFIIHADYEKQNLKPVTENFRYLAVSKTVGDIYTRISGMPTEVFPNPIEIHDSREAILIVSATRITSDKHGIKDRMETLSKRLKQRHIPFLWLCFTNYKGEINGVNIVPPFLDIIPYLRKADFVAQLSGSEACCMTALESLSVGTPMLVTKVPSFYEQGLDESNSIFFEFDMSNVDECIDKMLQKYEFKFSPRPDRWGEFLIHKPRGELKPMKKFKCKATGKVLNGGGISIKEFGGICKPGDVAEIAEERAEFLKSQGYVEILSEVVEEIPMKLGLPGDIAETKPKKTKKKK